MEPLALIVVDDEEKILKSYQRLFRKQDFVVLSASSPSRGLALIREKKSAAVVLSDFSMPEMDGIEFLQRVENERPDIIRLLITGYASLNNSMEAIRRSHIFEYVVKPWEPDELVLTINRAFKHYSLIAENKRLHELTIDQNEQLKVVNNTLEELVFERTAQLEEAVNAGVKMLAVAAEAKDDDTGEHIFRVQRLTEKICMELKMDRPLSKKVGFFSILHDVGKIHIPDNILKKKGALTNEEWEIMKTHPIIGEKILGQSPYYEIARQIARFHHENWDGSGYPDGLKENAIPLPARIVTVVDVFDALSHDRPYKSKWPMDMVMAEINRLVGKKFDPDVVKALFVVLEKKAIKMGE